MAKAKKLPSGAWRTLVYSHSELLFDNKGLPVLDNNGKQKKKPIYESFTAATAAESEFMAAEFKLKKSSQKSPLNISLREAIDWYIDDSKVLLSPTTIQGYKKIKKYAFQDIMDLPLKKITNKTLSDAVINESKRISKNSKKADPKPISAKTVHNEYGLITAVLNTYYSSLDVTTRLPKIDPKDKEILPPDVIYSIVKGTEIELAVMLAMWLSFSESEIRGLTKSNSISGDYLIIKEVVVDVDGKPVRKSQAKNVTRKRALRIPPYIKSLIDKVETDELVTISGKALYARFTKLLKRNGLPHMTFHDLRHVNASVMGLLRIPDKYAQDRGGWKTDHVMKKVYTHTFTEERLAVDSKIDDYFQKMIQHETQHEK